MTVGELGLRMSAREFADWRAYERVTGPFGAERQDVLAAMTAFYVVSALAGKKGKKPRLDKMVPRWDRPKQDAATMELYVRSLNRRLGGEEVSQG